MADSWVDDWISGSTYSKPSTYNTQRRGYITGGNFSVRYQMNRDHLVSISPPSFKKGCGGIDLFGGSVNYLNADLLIDKFEQIMGGALATYAYDLALNVLCEPCAKELKSLEALVDRINQLQLDDCKASKALVAIAEEYSGIGDSQQNTEAVSDFLISTGQVDNYRDVTQSGNDKSINDLLAENDRSKRDLVRGCPQALKNVFFTEGTILENIATEMGIDTSNVQLMRAMIGDIYISSDLEYAAVPPCPQNNPTNLNAIIYGDFYARRSGACVNDQINIGGVMFPSLYSWARDNIVEISDAMINKSQFTNDNISFINSIPHPILVQITTDIVMQGNDFDSAQTAENYAYMASLIYAYSMMRDLYNDIQNMLNLASVASFNQTAGDFNCASSLASKAELTVKEMRERALNFTTAIKEDYQTALAGIADKSEFVKLLRDTQKQAFLAPLRKVYE